MIPRKKSKVHEGFGLVFNFRTMLGFLTRGGGVGAESGRGLRALTTTGPVCGVDTGAGDMEGFNGGGVGVRIELGAGEGRGAEGVDCALRYAAGLGVTLWICCSLEELTFSLMTFCGGGPS